MNEKLRDTIANYNKSAESRWENHRIIELSKYAEQDEDTITMTLALGKFERTYHNIEINVQDGIWKIIKQSEPNDKVLDDVMTYVVLPTILQ